MDYRCGYCKRAFPEVENLLSADGNIRLIVKEFPILGAQSVLAAQFAIATQRIAGEVAYGDVHDALMSQNSDITLASLSELGDAFGLDTPAILAAMDSPEVAQVIDANRALADRLRISGTPTFVIEDQMIRGYVPAAQMQQMVDFLRTEG